MKIHFPPFSKLQNLEKAQESKTEFQAQYSLSRTKALFSRGELPDDVP